MTFWWEKIKIWWGEGPFPCRGEKANFWLVRFSPTCGKFPPSRENPIYIYTYIHIYMSIYLYVRSISRNSPISHTCSSCDRFIAYIDLY